MSGRFSRTKGGSSQVIDVDEIEEVEDVDEVTPAPPVPPRPLQLPPASASGDLEEDELSQPFVDVHELFNYYNHKHFGNRITRTYVEYSTRMTLCAGTCTFKGVQGCRIALSEPLLKYRPRSDLLSTLLHEMIHALLFITEGLAARDGVDGHGPKFMSHAQRINRAEAGKVNITPYHTFQGEVDVYRVHHWKCDRCDMLIKRAMNRAPAPRDPFWPSHQRRCGGSFVKIREPEKKKKVVKRAPKTRAVAVDTKSKENVEFPKGVMKTRRIDALLSGKSPKRPRPTSVSCPSCDAQVLYAQLNDHLDVCLANFSEDAGEDFVIPPSDEEVEAHELPPQRNRREGGGPQPTTARKGQGEVEVSNPTTVRAVHNKKSSEAGPSAIRRREQPRVPKSRPENVIVSSHDETRLRHTEIYDLTDSPKSNVNVEHSSRLPKSPRQIPHLEALRCEKDPIKKLVRQPDCLVKLAVDPRCVSDDELSNLFDPNTPSRPARTESSKCDLSSVLKPILHRETATDIEWVARRILRPLRLKGSRNDFSFHEAAQCAGMDLASYIQKVRRESDKEEDGSFVLCGDVLGIIDGVEDEGPVRSNPAPSALYGDATPRPSAGNGSVLEDPSRSNGRPASGSQGSEERAGAGASRSVAGTKPERLLSNSRTVNVGNCPVCDEVVPRTQLEAHVQECLNATDVAPIFEESFNSNRTRSRAGSPSGLAKGESQDAGELPRCPVCDVVISRKRLKSHVATCMMSAGLDNAF